MGAVANIDQRHVGPVEGRVVVGIEADALAADDGARGQQGGQLGIVDLCPDLVAEKLGGEIVRLGIDQHVLEDAVEAEAAGPPSGLKLALALLGAHLRGRHKVRRPPAAGGRLPRLGGAAPRIAP